MQRVITLCDRHQARSEDRDANVPPTSLSLNGREIEVDLCTECNEELAEALAPYFSEGRRPVRPSVAPPPQRRPGGRRLEGVERTASGKISQARLTAAEDGKFYCNRSNCGRAEWFEIDGERRHGIGFDRVQGATMHVVRSHGSLEPEPVKAAVGARV